MGCNCPGPELGPGIQGGPGQPAAFQDGFFVTFDDRTARFHEDLGDWISVGIHDAQSEQIEFGTAVHGALDQLQAVNMSFDGTVTPRLLKGGKERGFIVAQVFREACQQAAFCAVLPVGPGSCVPLLNHSDELPRKICTGCDLG